MNKESIKLIETFKSVRKYTETICVPLKIEDYSVQIVDFASPAKWHLGHTTWFFETFIAIAKIKGYRYFNKNYNYLFNSYYNHAGDRIPRPERGNLTRPCVEDVYNYRSYVDNILLEFMSNELSDDIIKIIILGLNHEQQHQELLLTDIKYNLAHNPLFPAYDENTCLLDAEKNTSTGLVHIDEGVYDIGYSEKGFCYDNELSFHKVYLNNFKLDKNLVSNGEWIEFIEDNAYGNFDLWLDEGWTWVNEYNINCPLYWHKIDNTWYSYTMAGLKKLDPDIIVKHVSFYEAAAFSKWKGRRLPTEFEWEAAADLLDWGQRWEWTYSAYLPYPRFYTNDGALGEYNGKFMVNQMVLRGGSVFTSPRHTRKSYRNFFHPDERWQCTGVRLAI